MQEMRIRSLGREDPPEEEMAPTPVFLPGKFHGSRSLVDCSPWGRKELDMARWACTHWDGEQKSVHLLIPAPVRTLPEPLGGCGWVKDFKMGGLSWPVWVAQCTPKEKIPFLRRKGEQGCQRRCLVEPVAGLAWDHWPTSAGSPSYPRASRRDRYAHPVSESDLQNCAFNKCVLFLTGLVYGNFLSQQ